VDEGDYPSSGPIEDQMRFLLRFAILAPSGHNTQPWRFVVSNSSITVYADPARRLPVVDPEDRELHISIGCSLVNLVIAGEHFGFSPRLEIPPEEEGWAAAVEFIEGEGAPGSPDLFPAIFRRHTNRSDLQEGMIDPEVLQILRSSADSDGLRLDLIPDDERKSEIAELVARGDLIQFRDRAFRRELAFWMRSNWTGSGDGMPGYAFGISDVPSLLSPLLIRMADLGRRQAETDRKRASQAPALGILSSLDDAKPAWLRTGMLLERLALSAAERGIWFAYFNQPLEVPELRGELRRLLKIREHPQILFRLGRAEPRRHTPRRSLEDVLL
jgi:hypothetical protein